MRSDLLKAIASAKEITNAIVLTHNIDFVFLQTVVLAAFRKCGHPTITVFADAQCAAESFAHQSAVLDGLGVRYRVVPVTMEAGFRFHPKAALLSGEKEAVLFVGSGNLTFGGWRENAEVWNRFDSVSDGPSAFAEFKSYLEEVLKRVPLREAVADEVAEAFDGATRHWMSDERTSTSQSLLGRVGSGRSLLASMRALRGPASIDELVVCSPYFDPEGVALRALIDDVAPRRTTVLHQPKGSTLTRQAFAPSEGVASLKQVSFEHLTEDGSKRSAFVHAKFYGLRRADNVLVFSGSANCSRAALTAENTAGNAELMVVRQLSTADFDSALLGEFVDVVPTPLAEQSPEPEPPLETSSLRILAARLDGGALRVAFSPIRAQPLSLEVDGASVEASVVEPGIVNATFGGEPRFVRLQASTDGVDTWSMPAWIDLERHLRASARGRGFADSVRARMQPGSWTATAWTEVMEVFCKHLAYMPVRDSGRVTGGGEDGQGGSDDRSFTYADVFSTGYEAPPLSGLTELTVKLEGGKEQSLQQLLLRYFGVGSATEPGEPASGSGDDSDADAVDRPESLPTKKAEAPPLTEADKRRIQKVLVQVEEAMTTDQFLSERRADQLAADLKVAAVLLRTALREEWIDSAAFFQTTHRVWSALFFSGSPELNQGWLEYRVRKADDPDSLISSLRSPSLSAALLAWAFAVAPDESSAASARFQLAVALAVARLPWLWDAGDGQAVGRELEVLLAHTGLSNTSPETVRGAWAQTLRRGHALLRLEAAASAIPSAVLRSRIRTTELREGALLWQGSAGYCVVTRTTARAEGQKVPVLRLQNRAENSHFVAPFTLPLDALLDEQVIPMTPAFDAEPRRALREFLAEIRGALVAVASAPPPQGSPKGVPRNTR